MITPTITISLAERVTNDLLTAGADFVEIFLEDTRRMEMAWSDSKPSSSIRRRLGGAGIRIYVGHEVFYSSTSDPSERGLMTAASFLKSMCSGNGQRRSRDVFKSHCGEIHRHENMDVRYIERAQEILRRMDVAAREQAYVSQVSPYVRQWVQDVMILNSDGLWVSDVRAYVHVGVNVTVEQDGGREQFSWREAGQGSLEFVEGLDLENQAQIAARTAKQLLSAKEAPSGEMPVVIDNAGGVIFHEACGHGLETTAVAKKSSVFCEKLGTQIAHPCVNAYDDGNIGPHAFGNLTIDDEGMPIQRTTLIENGILKSYLADHMGSKKTGYARTGSGRRENFTYAPTSRMRNTFIAPGTDSFESLIRDVDYGLFAKTMGGGSVTTSTGEFNFAVKEAFIIRNGRIEEPVKGASLLGRGIDILPKIVRVANNLGFDPGYCGSISGIVPITCGQPTLLVSSILVGGGHSR